MFLFSESANFVCEVAAILRDEVCISHKGDVCQNIFLLLMLRFHWTENVAGRS